MLRREWVGRGNCRCAASCREVDEVAGSAIHSVNFVAFVRSGQGISLNPVNQRDQRAAAMRLVDASKPIPTLQAGQPWVGRQAFLNDPSPELVSGSTSPQATELLVEGWMLKQVQHDGNELEERPL
jgi:hypothetical protein